MKLLFSRFGGKKNKSKEIISYFPEHETYVEPFLGSGAIFLEKESVKLSVLNDLDPIVYNIFNLSKQFGEDFDKLNQSGGLNWTTDKDRWITYKQSLTLDLDDPIELLFRSIYVIHNSWSGIGTSFTPNRRRNPIYKVKLGDYKNILTPTHIWKKDYVQILKMYDSPDTFFYLDPPYDIALEKNYYEYDNNMTLETLKETLESLEGMFCLSLDITPKTTVLFKNFKCHKIDFNYKTTTNKDSREEYLITNY
jgi:DNA adenine methylase